MSKVSIIIPARHELYLQETIDNILKSATGDIEVIVILDGYWPDPILKEDPRLIIFHRERQGMREAINAGISLSRGEYLMKVDAHCMFSEGFDEALQKNCDKDWVVIPRRYSIETETNPWSIRTHRQFVDYEYLSWPWRKDAIKEGMIAQVWDQRIFKRINILLDENMSFQGSCWFTPKEHFLKRIGRMDSTGYGTFVGEAQEIGLKVWLGGGKVMVNKSVWYGHLWKGEPYREKFFAKYGERYSRLGSTEFRNGNRFSVDYWMNNRWKDRIHDLEWLIDRFWPVPSWPEDKGKWNQNH